MKKLLLIFVILLLTASFDEIGRETRLGKFLQTRSVDSFLANVSFWLSDNEENEDSYKNITNTGSDEKNTIITSHQNLEANTQATSLQSADISNSTPQNENKINESDENALAHIQQTSLANLLQESVNAQNADKKAFDEVQKKQEEKALAIKAENEQTENELTEEKVNNTDIHEDLQETESTLIEIINTKTQTFNNSYRASFTIINKSEVQQNGKIIFYLVFEDNKKLAFSDIGASFRTRYQVDKEYTLAKTPEITNYLEKNIAEFIQAEFLNINDNALLIRKNLTLEN